MAAEVAATVLPPPGWAFESLRPLFSSAPAELCRLAGRATQILEWIARTRSAEAAAHRPGRRPATGQRSARRAGSLPTADRPRHYRCRCSRHADPSRPGAPLPPDLFSVLAGFVEPGETLEECVAREVREETGIVTREIRYFSSQPWPFRTR